VTPGPPRRCGVDAAVVLCAGVAARLRPLSYLRAKAAFPLAGEPLVRRIVRRLAAAGVSRVVVNLHHLPESVTGALGDGSDLGAQVRYSWEPTLLGSAGGPARARTLIDAPRFWIVNGDTLSDVDLAAVEEAHLAAGAQVTMALMPNPDPEKYGSVMLDAANRVTAFARGRTRSPGYHFVGVQLVESGVFDAVPTDRPSETVRGVYAALVEDRPGAVRGWAAPDPNFRDIGTAADYLAASLEVAAAEGKPHTVVAKTADVDATARVVRSTIWERAAVGPAAEIVECVVASDCRIPAGARFARRVIARADDLPPDILGERVGGLVAVPMEAP
jgi:mannose-1-phosphate guanylyltransferase